MKCAYCSAEIKKGTGMMYVYRIGDTAFYCSQACFQNHVVMDRKINQKIVARNLKGTAMEKRPKAARAEKKVQAPATPATAKK